MSATIERKVIVRLKGTRLKSAKINGQAVKLTTPQRGFTAHRCGTQRVKVSFGPRPTIVQDGVDDVDVVQEIPALTTHGDGALASGVGLAYTPRPDSSITLMVNGAAMEGAEYFFTRGSSLLPLPRADIQAGDLIRWRASEADFDLASTDVLSVLYERLL